MHSVNVILLKLIGKALDNILDRIFSVAGALVLSQLPQLILQYIDTLKGALAEARRNVSVFREQALFVGKSLEVFIDKHLTDPDPDFQASGRAMLQAVERLQEYEAAHQALTTAPIWQRPFLFLYHYDSGLYSLADFHPGIPLTLEGLIYAGVGILLGLAFYHGILRMPFYLLSKNKKVDSEGDHRKE